MTERYPPPGASNDPNDDCPYSWISEWLCEYVDGTMDPSMRAVFDEYLEANPKLAEHVERLCRTRSLLNDCECQHQAAQRTKERVQKVPIGESVLAPAKKESDRNALSQSASAPPSFPVRAGTVAAVASAMTLMLGVGVVAGATFFSNRVYSSEGPAATEQTTTPAPPQQHAPDRPAVLPPAAAAKAGAASRWPYSSSGPSPMLQQFQVEAPFAPMTTNSTPMDSMHGRSMSRPAVLLQQTRARP